MSRAKKAAAVVEAQEETSPAAVIVPREPFVTVAADKESPADECVCSHLRQSHSGRGAEKRCTVAHVYGFGKCDCTVFRMRVKR